jgi:hypothetical protein
MLLGRSSSNAGHKKYTSVHHAAGKLLEHLGQQNLTEIVMSPARLFDLTLLPVCLRSTHSFQTGGEDSAAEPLERSPAGEDPTRNLTGLAELCHMLVFKRLSQYWKCATICDGSRGTTEPPADDRTNSTGDGAEAGGGGGEEEDPAACGSSNEMTLQLALDDRAALCAGLAVCFDEDSQLDDTGELPVAATPLAHAPPISTAQAQEAVHFVMVSLQVVSNCKFAVYVGEIKSILDCVTAVLRHPMVACTLRSNVAKSPFGLDKGWLSTLIGYVASIYRTFAPPGSVVIPPEDTTEGVQDFGAGGPPPKHGAEGAAAGGGAAADALTFEETQCLFLLVEELDRRLRPHSIPPVVGGVHGARFSTEIYTRGCHWSPRQLA